MEQVKTERSDITSNFLLIQFGSGAASFSKTDKVASSKVISDANAISDSGKFIKKLLAGSDKELKELNSAIGDMRTYVYYHTVPWTHSEGKKRGPRLLPTARSFDFLKGYKELQDKYNIALQEFANVYDQRVTEALSNLGTLANGAEYPSREEMMGRYFVSLDIEPLPESADFSRLNIPAEMAQMLGDKMVAKQSKAMENVMDDLKKRTLEVVERMATQLGKVGRGEKTNLYKSLVSNVQMIAGMLRSCNVTGDDSINQLADNIEDKLCQYDTAQLKNSVSKAKEVSEAATQIVGDIDADIYF